MFTAEESVLRDLKALLMEANQKVPPFLQQMDALSDDLIDLGGQYINFDYGLYTLSTAERIVVSHTTR